MKRISTPLMLFLTLLASTALGNPAEYWELTSKDGRTIKAIPVAVIGAQIRIQREDQQEFNVSPNLFAKEDEKRLMDWAFHFLLENDRLLKIEADQVKDQVGKSKGNLQITTLYDDGSKDVSNFQDAVVYKDYKYSYEIKITNKSNFEFDGLTVTYVAYATEQSTFGTQERHVAGMLPLRHLPADKTSQYLTKSFEFEKVSVKQGYEDPKQKFRLSGLWLKIYRDGKLVHQFATANALMQGPDDHPTLSDSGASQPKRPLMIGN